MPKLIMTRGLPGSGKSLWALQALNAMSEAGESVCIVNKDDIREWLKATTHWTWSPENEKVVIAERDARISKQLASGGIAISSDTNFGKHEAHLRELAKKHGAEFEIKDFTKVPVEICIERDSKREATVGSKVIVDMYQKYVLPNNVEVYVHPTDRPITIICDLDGTLALHNGRSPFDYARCGEDRVNDAVAHIVRLYASNGYTIIYCSGREAWCQPQTEGWLKENLLPFAGRHKLFMRATGDHRKDNIVKLELFNNYIRKDYNVKFVLDDRDQVIRMWRDLGLTCLQVNYGAF